MKRIDLIKKITLKFGGANSSWYAKLNGNRKIDIKTALQLKDEFNITTIMDRRFRKSLFYFPT